MPRAKFAGPFGSTGLNLGVAGLIGVLVPMFVSMLTGCVIPPSLEVDNGDAGVNSPPAILSVTSDQQAQAEAIKANATQPPIFICPLLKSLVNDPVSGYSGPLAPKDAHA